MSEADIDVIVSVEIDDDVLAHYGVKRRSGRYPWGSGKEPMQSGRHLIGHVEELRRQGLTEKQIADGLNLSTTELRARMSIAKTERRQAQANEALRLRDKGMGPSAISRHMGVPESSVRVLLDPAMETRRNELEVTAKVLRDKVGKDGFLDVGTGTEAWRGISRNKLDTAVQVLKEQGYVTHNVQVLQLGTGKKTTIKVLAPPGTTYTDIVRAPEKIQTLAAFSTDGGHTLQVAKPPVSISSRRVDVKYGPEGGDQADGVIYVRPGVPDVSLGGSRYSQVRVAVDGTHYIKGMAMYKDGLPPGVDLQFNTTAKRTGNKLDALKPLSDDPERPFTSVIEMQRTYTGKDGKQHQSLMNVVNSEGDWRKWNQSLSSQVLSKQPESLARRQLGLDLKSRRAELEEIRQVTNPVVKRKLLQTFGDETDRAVADLHAAAMPRQGTHIILPFSSIKKGEVYAPNYNNGENVVLIRHPHGGRFEIPELTVNNRNREAASVLGPGIAGKMHAAVDAIGIHPDVAKRLSGADFDGDTVLVIPNPRHSIKTTSALAGLSHFDPRTAYPPYHGMKTVDGGTWDSVKKAVDFHGNKPKGAPKQHQMGDVSNLITDMTIKKARPDEIAAAVRHSMVVIDSEKHHLDVKQSYEDNGIAHLKEKYQGGKRAGASTIISRAGSELHVNEFRPRPARRGGSIDPATGEKVFEPTGRGYTKAGRYYPATTKVPRISTIRDARQLVSDAATPMELIYADHANQLKALANGARKESLSLGSHKYSPSAAKTYASHVSRLNAALNLAEKNAPLERAAQLIANHSVSARVSYDPGIKSDPDRLRKVRYQELERARARVGARKHQIEISNDEWHAIQAGAISSHKLSRIITHADLKKLKTLATPRTARVMTPAKIALARARLSTGHTQAEVARSLGIPVSTLNTALLREEE